MNDRRRLAAKVLLLFAPFLCAEARLSAHPMGNFSINHYALVMPGAQGVEVLYVLDFAELPTLQLLQSWDLKKDSAPANLNRKTRAAAADWMRHLQFTANGSPVNAHLERTDYTIRDGAGGLPVIRVNSHLKVSAGPGDFTYEDRNFEQRAGWKEVVIEVRAGASVANATPAGTDRSRALTAYPQDPTVAPPQDLSAKFRWTAALPVVTQNAPVVAPPPAKPSVQPEAVPPASSANAVVATGATPAEAQSYGTVKRGDFLSRTLTQSKGSLPLSLALICLAAAFGVGALHAVEPGHGKTMVAAYLVGSRGTIRQALFLGGMVTFTHTISVFALGVVTLFLSQYVLPETLTRVMGVISGVSIIWIGGLLLYRRGHKLWSRAGTAHSHSHAHAHAHHSHDHAHDHGHAHGHSHEHDHAHSSHDHAHDQSAHHHHHEQNAALTHTHGGHTHTHVPEGDVTLGSLVALGVSGGLVPCPAALVLLLSCISIGRPAFGLLLLISFSLGLALVLMLIGVMVLVVKNAVPKSGQPSHTQLWAVYAPVASAALIFGIGIYMTGVAVGAFPIVRLIG